MKPTLEEATVSWISLKTKQEGQGWGLDLPFHHTTRAASQALLTDAVTGDTMMRGCRPTAQRNTLRLLDPGGLAYPSTDVVP